MQEPHLNLLVGMYTAHPWSLRHLEGGGSEYFSPKWLYYAYSELLLVKYAA